LKKIDEKLFSKDRKKINLAYALMHQRYTSIKAAKVLDEKKVFLITKTGAALNHFRLNVLCTLKSTISLKNVQIFTFKK
jgi:hypothetical protein